MSWLGTHRAASSLFVGREFEIKIHAQIIESLSRFPSKFTSICRSMISCHQKEGDTMIVTFDAALSTADRLPVRQFLVCTVSVAALLSGIEFGQPAAAQPLPTGGAVVRGNVAIAQPSPTGLTITQTGHTGIVNWSSFSIGQGYQVQFNNGAGATLNRVTGNVPSS